MRLSSLHRWSLVPGSLGLLLAGIAWAALAPTTAQAQTRPPYGTANPTGYHSASYSQPAVSPYLNLGTNADGVSNYQSLVKPMIDEREALQRQSAYIQQLQQQVQARGGADPRDPRARNPTGRPVSAPRYFNYSHYYSNIR